jgi:site-specific DNA-methyltransferase (adenine-specific)
VATFEIHHGDNRDVLKTLADNSVDSVVTDPPYELGFMGKSWDASGIAYSVELWQEVLRVLKPGGHLLAFSGSRTYHRMVVAIEDAGFEIRDQIMWIYGSGFPKSLDIAKAMDKSLGLQGEKIGERTFGKTSTGQGAGWNENAVAATGKQDVFAPASPNAKQWQGWGTALKPAHEPVVVARKPLIGTVAANVLTYGTGGLNIDASRVGRAEGDDSVAGKRTATFGTQETQSGGDGSGGWEQNEGGRWPANVIHDGSDEVVELFPANAGGGHWVKTKVTGYGEFGGGKSEYFGQGEKDGKGSAARFFYCAKASKKDRNEGLDLEQFPLRHYTTANKMGGETDTMLTGSGNPRDSRKQNHHPTVKPTDLMRYLCRLVTPPNGIVLDPFMGSGSTGKAAIYEGFNFVGIEMTDEYIPIAKARIEFAVNEMADKLL